MLEKLSGIEARFKQIDSELLEVGGNYQRAAELNKERLELEPVVEKAREYRQAVKNLEENRAKLETLEAEITEVLFPADPNDSKNVIVEIRAGTGGAEASLFAADLFRMYTRYADLQGWKTEILSENAIGIGGYKEIVFQIKGKGAFSKLKYESGVHRVQRVPTTESSGRIHTSTATVAVLAEVDEVEIDIPVSDIDVEVFKAGGAGGQNVQKNSTAIRITHKPTGMVVTCQDERSQLQNKLRAMSILRARLFEIEDEKRRSAEEADRRSQVGTGERSEKIRTYNWPQNRVTDHRIGVSSYNLPGVMAGDIDQFIDELSTRDEAGRVAASGAGDDED